MGRKRGRAKVLAQDVVPPGCCKIIDDHHKQGIIDENNLVCVWRKPCFVTMQMHMSNMTTIVASVGCWALGVSSCGGSLRLTLVTCCSLRSLVTPHRRDSIGLSYFMALWIHCTETGVYDVLYVIWKFKEIGYCRANHLM